ncbi:MAG: hypothetical protein FJX74_16880 [Armatimonadetes bacterium]|nr:hypothetical protein [Armatimonadota bacterium]
MLRAAAVVLVLVIVCGYLALFLSWNAAPQPIATWQWGDSKYVQPMPIGLLFIGGVLLGAVAMALALWGPWNGLKAGELQQRELIQRAKAKLKSQDTKIKELTRLLEEQPKSPAPEGAEVELPEAAKAAAAAVDEAVAPAKPGPAGKPDAPTSEDDPEVI